MKKHVISLFFVTICAITLTGCGSVYESSKSGYTKATSVKGVEFDMPDAFLSAATAITTIDEDEDYSGNTYLYKDGEKSYILFNIEQVVVTVQSGTEFALQNTKDKTDGITKKSINDTWFTPVGKKFSYDDSKKKGTYKLIGDVCGDVSITQELYSTCYGKFAMIEKDGYECSIFAGVPAESMDDISSKQKKVIEHIVKSFCLADNYTESDDSKGKMESTEKEANTESQIENEKTEPTTEAEKIEVTVNEGTRKPEKTKEEEPVDIEPEKETDGTDAAGTDEFKYSDIYNLLAIGDTGRLNVLANNGKDVNSTYIKLDKLYTGEEAISMIKRYRSSSSSKTKYTAPPDGYSWHVMEYETEKKPEEQYVNIELKGFDGEKLKYNGIVISSRTYDIFDEAKLTNSGCQKLYCYYAIPNGCKEYMLECGSRSKDTSETACFKISGY